MNAAARRAVRCAVVGLVATLASAAALACGHCVEDRIAAVYDHALVQRTLAGKHQVAYFAWDGLTERSEAVRMKMLALGEATTGVDKGSVRVAMDPAAIAVAFDPRRTSAEAVAAALQKKLGALKLSLIPLQPPRAGAP
jgi:hypothetical protein